MKILIIGELKITRTLYFMLKLKGYSPTRAHCNQEVEWLLSNNDYSVIIIDRPNICENLPLIFNEHIKRTRLFFIAKNNLGFFRDFSNISDFIVWVKCEYNDYSLINYIESPASRMVKNKVLFGNVDYDMTYDFFTCKGKLIKLSKLRRKILLFLFLHEGDEKQLVQKVWGDNYPKGAPLKRYLRLIQRKLIDHHSNLRIDSIKCCFYEVK